MTHSQPVMKDDVWAIVPAAGIGRRMGGVQPKQYLPLVDKTVIEHTLSRLLSVNAIKGLMVALHQHDQKFPSLAIGQHEKIMTVQGGGERSDSVLAALNSLQKKAKLSDWILVHDAARPCIRPQAILSLLNTLASDSVGGILAVPASDTLKQVQTLESSQKGIIEKTLNRQLIWQAQTPQLFRYGLLRDALQNAQEKQLTITDEASAIELNGCSPKVIMGHHDNIKVTHPEDLVMAEAILKQQGVIL